MLAGALFCVLSRIRPLAGIGLVQVVLQRRQLKSGEIGLAEKLSGVAWGHGRARRGYPNNCGLMYFPPALFLSAATPTVPPANSSRAPLNVQGNAQSNINYSNDFTILRHESFLVQ